MEKFREMCHFGNNYFSYNLYSALQGGYEQKKGIEIEYICTRTEAWTVTSFIGPPLEQRSGGGRADMTAGERFEHNVVAFWAAP